MFFRRFCCTKSCTSCSIRFDRFLLTQPPRLLRYVHCVNFFVPLIEINLCYNQENKDSDGNIYG